jgi:stress-induced morphogen
MGVRWRAGRPEATPLARNPAAARYLLRVPSTEEVNERIERALPGARATVTDLTGGGDHLRAEVVYDGFAGLSRIEQHRLVYDVFDGEIGGAIHALSLKTSFEGPKGET